MSANSSVSLVQLDFDGFKSSLKKYLREQTRFKDYDFTGPNISVLLDLLAYNTFHNAFYLNMVGNEMFLDSTLMRDSAVSHAKELNYLPRSFRSSKALVDITLIPDRNRASVVVPKNATFSASVGSNTYTFTTNKSYVAIQSDNNVFTVSDVELYEGTYQTESFVMNRGSDQRFIIGNPFVDTSSISVIVSEDDVISEFTLTQSLLGVTEESEIFFLQAAEQDKFEILFGNGVFGRKPKNGATIIVEFRACSGELPNGANEFSADRPIDGVSTVVVQTTTRASGGKIYESIDSIKFNAPRHYQTQERAVTVEDYKIMLQQQFSEINDLNVYGGEEVDPPQYGRVFIAADIAGYDGIPDYKKEEYTVWLKQRTPLTIEPLFVDPVFIYGKVVIDAQYDRTSTDLSRTELISRIRAAVRSFARDEFGKFHADVKISKLAAAVDGAHDSIVSSFVDLYPYMQYVPLLNEKISFNINFPFAIKVVGAELPKKYNRDIIRNIFSSRFTSDGKLCRIEDDNDGNLRLVSEFKDTVRVIKNIGTVDYKKGILRITDIEINEYVGDGINFYVISEDRNFRFKRNYFFQLNNDDIEVQLKGIGE